MKVLLFIFIISIICCCTNSSVRKSDNNKVVKIPKNERLIFFRNKQIMNSEEMSRKSEREFQQLHEISNFHFDTDTIKYVKDTIKISFLLCVNACESYTGDIEFRKDSLILKRINTGDILCMSERVDRIIYQIYNPMNQKYNIIIEN